MVMVVMMMVVIVVIVIVVKEVLQGVDFLDDLGDEAPLGLVRHDHELVRLRLKL